MGSIACELKHKLLFTVLCDVLSKGQQSESHQANHLKSSTDPIWKLRRRFSTTDSGIGVDYVINIYKNNTDVYAQGATVPQC